MGSVASRFSDEVYLTSDNPRTEAPDRIAQDVLKGVEGRSIQVILDRKQAIEAALRRARGGDVVLIAGKGHETEQVVGNDRRPFDDREVAEKILWQITC